MRMERIAAVVAVALLCGAAKVTVDVRGLPKPPPPRALDEATRAKALETFSARCALCHGPAGEGDGPNATMMKPKPRRFSDALWQASVTDDQIRQVIVQGGMARKLSPLMLASPDLKDKPELDALVAFIRSRRAPEGTARLTFGTGPAARVAVADATASAAGGAARFDVLDVPDGVWPVVVHGVSGEHCRANATVQGADVSVVCERALPPTPPPP